jgi:hypothetical protein
MATSTLGSGTLVLAGTTSGTTTVTATAVAGTTTLTLPAATDTLVGKATTDTLTNKTLTTPSVSSPTISDGTANGVAYLNGSKVLTTGSALVFNGTNLGVGVTPNAAWGGSAAVAIDLQSYGGALSSNGTGSTSTNLSHGAYFNGTNWIQKATDVTGARYQMTGSSLGSAHAWFVAPNSTAGGTISFTQAMTLDASGGLKVLNTIGVGNTAPSTSGAGITFPATDSPSSNANTLDDYEEGIWIPSIGGTATYTLQSGTYTKVGRLVSVSAVLQINVIGTGSVNTITGLPFTRDSVNNQAPGSMTFISAISSTVSYLVPVVQVNTSTVIFQGLAIVGNTTSQINVFQNSARVDFQITYQTT